MALLLSAVHGGTKESPALHTILQDVQVSVSGYFYAVDFGPEVRPRSHRVSKEKRCTCYLGAGCPAVLAVAEYLKAGGERAPDPPPGYYPVAPAACPVCGAATIYDQQLSSKSRGAGWRCAQGDAGHYWQAHFQVLREKALANPWLYPPVVIRDGARLLAYDGILPNDQVLYPGVKRDAVITTESRYHVGCLE